MIFNQNGKYIMGHTCNYISWKPFNLRVNIADALFGVQTPPVEAVISFEVLPRGFVILPHPGDTYGIPSRVFRPSSPSLAALEALEKQSCPWSWPARTGWVGGSARQGRTTGWPQLIETIRTLEQQYICTCTQEEVFSELSHYR